MKGCTSSNIVWSGVVGHRHDRFSREMGIDSIEKTTGSSNDVWYRRRVVLNKDRNDEGFVVT